MGVKMTFVGEIRREIKRCGVSCYQISKVTGVSQSSLIKFMGGTGLDYEALNRVAAAVGLHVKRNPAVARKLALKAVKRGRPPKKSSE